MKLKSLLCSAVCAGIVAMGCATPTTPELNQAQSTYARAQSDPQVVQNAPVELYEAEQALEMAKNAESTEEQRHYAYISQKKVEIAETNATRAATMEEAQRLREEQEDFLLAIRRQEAEQASREAEAAEAKLRAYHAQDRQEELTEARQKAQEAQAELEQMAKQTDEGLVLTLGDVLFEFNRDDLKPGAERNLQNVSTYLRENPERKVLIEGFTDSVGSASYNRRLSEQRAEAVAEALRADGISPERITIRGLGEDYPVATNNTAAGRQQNRRVEITILNQDAEGTGRSGT